LSAEAGDTIAFNVHVSLNLTPYNIPAMAVPIRNLPSMPWSPTYDFPHPIANIKSSNASRRMTNEMSYALVEMMTWQGLGDIINKFRKETLGLGELSQVKIDSDMNWQAQRCFDAES
jgi:hypothetical protein